MKLFLKLLFVFSVFLVGCHSDIYTKKLATDALKHKGSKPVVAGFLDLRYSENEGISFSMFTNMEESIRKPVLVSLQGFSTLMLIGVIFYLRKRPAMSLFPFALILAGAFGNLFDRIRYGYVVDFIHFHIQDGFSWPIFNLADIWISIGIGILILQILTNRDPFKPIKSAPPQMPVSS